MQFVEKLRLKSSQIYEFISVFETPHIPFPHPNPQPQPLDDKHMRQWTETSLATKMDKSALIQIMALPRTGDKSGIFWTNYVWVHWRIYASPGLDDLNKESFTYSTEKNFYYSILILRHVGYYCTSIMSSLDTNDQRVPKGHWTYPIHQVLPSLHRPSSS